MFQIQDRIVLKGTKKMAGVVLGIPESGNENRVLVCWDVNDVSYHHRSFNDLYKAHELDNMEITMAFIKGKPDNFSVINQDLIEDDLSKIEVMVNPETSTKMKTPCRWWVVRGSVKNYTLSFVSKEKTKEEAERKVEILKEAAMYEGRVLSTYFCFENTEAEQDEN